MRPGAIKLHVVDGNADHFILQFDRAGRVEVSVVSGRIIAHVYEGSKVKPDQEPLGMYDGFEVSLGEENDDWEA